MHKTSKRKSGRPICFAYFGILLPWILVDGGPYCFNKLCLAKLVLLSLACFTHGMTSPFQTNSSYHTSYTGNDITRVLAGLHKTEGEVAILHNTWCQIKISIITWSFLTCATILWQEPMQFHSTANTLHLIIKGHLPHGNPVPWWIGCQSAIQKPPTTFFSFFDQYQWYSKQETGRGGCVWLHYCCMRWYHILKPVV